MNIGIVLILLVAIVQVYNVLSSNLMRAALVKKYKERLSFESVPIPSIVEDNQILVKISACGCCHTDVHVIDGDWTVKSRLPIIPGHEGAGSVVDVSTIAPKVCQFKIQL